jgi:hypothetical protein
MLPSVGDDQIITNLSFSGFGDKFLTTHAR